MAEINSKIDALLTYAEQQGLCLWQYNGRDKDEIGSLSGWEDLLWDPIELRQALIDYPDQPRAGVSYTGYSYADDITEPQRWRIVSPHEIYAKYQRKIYEAEQELNSWKDTAQYFKEIWIDKTLKPWKE
jgi:hypothetical protein